MKYIFTILLFTTNTLAFTLSGDAVATYDKSVITVDVGSDIGTGQCAGFPDTPEEILEMVREAGTRYWNKVATSDIEIRPGTVIDVNSNFYTEQICTTGSCVPKVTMSDVLVVCNNNASAINGFGSSATLAITLSNYSTGTTILGSIVALNGRNLPNQYSTLSRDNKISVIAHEIGHAIGLGHSKFESALMYSLNIEKRRKLGRDDWNGATALYPKKEPIGGACGTIIYKNDGNGPKGGPLILALSLLLFIFIGSKLNFRKLHALN